MGYIILSILIDLIKLILIRVLINRSNLMTSSRSDSTTDSDFCDHVNTYFLYDKPWTTGWGKSSLEKKFSVSYQKRGEGISASPLKRGEPILQVSCTFRYVSPRC